MIKITKIEAIPAPQKLTRVAAYCRVSTDSEAQLDSLAVQKAHYSALIASRSDWSFAGLYFDEGISGTSTAGRAGFISLMESCRQGMIDLVLTKSISRFSRNTEDMLRNIRILKRLGIGVFFERENINTLTDDGEYMLSILTSFAQDESESISANGRWSAQKRFQAGNYVVSTPPYGYIKSGKTMAIDDETAPVIREIFALVLEGRGMDSIARELNRRGVLPPRGKKWYPASIYGFLKNEAYIGDLRLQKHYTDFDYKVRRNMGELPQYYVKDHHPAIIDRETFAKASEMVAKNRKLKNIEKGTSKYHKRYPFSGKIHCGECGHSFKRKAHKTPKGVRIDWVCSSHLQNVKACRMGYILDDSIRNAAQTMRNKLVFSRESMLLPLVRELRRTNVGVASAEISEIKKSIEENIESRQRLRGLLGKNYLEPALFARENGALLVRHRELMERKSELEEVSLSSDRRLSELEKLYREIAMAEISESFDEEFFSTFVSDVKVYSNHLLGFTLTCGIELKEEI